MFHGLQLYRSAIVSPLIDYILHILRYLALEVKLFPGLRMHESKRLSMKALPGAQGKAVVNRLFIFSKASAPQNIVTPVSLVIKQGMADMLHMHPYLMGAPCFELALYEGYIAKAFQHFIMGDRRFPLFTVHEYSHEHAIFRVSPNICFNGAFLLCYIAPHQCRVKTFGLFSEKLACQVCFGFRCFGY